MGVRVLLSLVSVFALAFPVVGNVMSMQQLADLISSNHGIVLHFFGGFWIIQWSVFSSNTLHVLCVQCQPTSVYFHMFNALPCFHWKLLACSSQLWGYWGRVIPAPGVTTTKRLNNTSQRANWKHIPLEHIYCWRNWFDNSGTLELVA